MYYKYGCKILGWKIEIWAIKHFRTPDLEIMPLLRHPRNPKQPRWIPRNVLEVKKQQFRQKIKVPKSLNEEVTSIFTYPQVDS